MTCSENGDLTLHSIVTINRNLKLNTLFFAYGQVILADSEDEFQYSVCNLQNKAKDCNMEISAVKTKIIASQ
jgi:hypothetical protein